MRTRKKRIVLCLASYLAFARGLDSGCHGLGKSSLHFALQLLLQSRSSGLATSGPHVSRRLHVTTET